jgi:hypothetical protein
MFPQSNEYLKRYKFISFDTEDNGKSKTLYCDFFDGEKHETIFGNYDKQNPLDDIIKHFYYVGKSKKNIVFIANNLEYDLTNIFRKNDLQLLQLLYLGNRLIKAELDGILFLDAYNLTGKLSI